MGNPDFIHFLSGFDAEDSKQIFDDCPKPKKRRLDHLTWEEKIQRKKLKNRVAAQTSRDRKKAKIEQMQANLNELYQRNDTLLYECENLKALNERLVAENAQIMAALKEPCPGCRQNRSVVCDITNGSAESILRPQGVVTHPAAALAVPTQVTDLLKIVLACLLYRTCSKNWTKTSILERCSKISPEIWRRLLRKQIVKNQILVDKGRIMKWWGRHQKTWNPVEVQG